MWGEKDLGFAVGLKAVVFDDASIRLRCLEDLDATNSIPVDRVLDDLWYGMPVYADAVAAVANYDIAAQLGPTMVREVDSVSS